MPIVYRSYQDVDKTLDDLIEAVNSLDSTNIYEVGGWNVNDNDTGEGNIGTEGDTILLDSANAAIYINDTTYGNQGIQIEYNSGSPRFYVGDGATAYVKFDGTKFEFNAANASLDASGNLTVTAGTIGGWTVTATDIKDTAGLVGMSSTVTGGDDIRFFAGHTTPTSAPFYVTEAGVLVASSATITGSVTATSGAIGGWDINATTLDSGSDEIVLDSANIQISVNDTTYGNDGIQLDYNAGNPRFYCGDGANEYFQFDGTNLSWKGSNSSLTAGGKLTTTDASIGTWLVDATSIGDNAAQASSKILLDASNTLIRVGPTSGSYITIDGDTGVAAAPISIESNNYTPGSLGSGFHLSQDLLEVGNIRARGKIITSVFEKDTISSVGGSLIVTKSDILDTDMTALDASTLTITGDDEFALNEVIRMKDGTEDEWMLVTNIGSKPTYEVTRDLAGDYAADTNPIWKKGTAVVSMGITGTGWIENVGSGTDSPYISIVQRNSAAYNDYTEQVRMGNLNGVTGNSDFGITAGAGEVTLNSTGLDIKEFNTNSKQYAQANAVTWVANDGDTAAEISSTHDTTNNVRYTQVASFLDIGTVAPDNLWVQIGCAKTEADLIAETAPLGISQINIQKDGADYNVEYGIFAAGGVNGNGNINIQADGAGAGVSGVDLQADTITLQSSNNLVNGHLGIRDGNELRFWDAGNSNYLGFEAPALTGNQIWVLPDADGPANEALGTDGGGNLIWRTHDELAGFVANEHIDWTGAADNFQTTGSVTALSNNGIDIGAAGDADADLITVNVTGTPKIFWDESEDSFAIDNGHLFQVNSTGNDKNIQISHNDTDALIHNSSGKILVQSADLLTNALEHLVIEDSGGNDLAIFHSGAATTGLNLLGDDNAKDAHLRTYGFNNVKYLDVSHDDTDGQITTSSGDLVLDSDSGYVVAPFIGFRAYNSVQDVVNANDTIVCDTEIYDIGSNYATATGIFTAPVAGYYHFDAATSYSPTVDQKRYGFYLTGSTAGNFCQTVTQASGTSQPYIYGSATINLAANETVTMSVVETEAGTATLKAGRAQTFFSGYLITKD